MMDAASHRHPELEDRISAEMSGIHTEIVALRVETRQGFAAVRDEMRHGFTAMTQVLGQILARLPEADGDA